MFDRYPPRASKQENFYLFRQCQHDQHIRSTRRTMHLRAFRDKDDNEDRIIDELLIY